MGGRGEWGVDEYQLSRVGSEISGKHPSIRLLSHLPAPQKEPQTDFFDCLAEFYAFPTDR